MYYIIEVRRNDRFEYYHSGETQAEVLQKCQKEDTLTDREALVLLYNGSLHLEHGTFLGDRVDFILSPTHWDEN
jgi:hypothetical protein